MRFFFAEDSKRSNFNVKPVRVGVVGCGYWGPNLIRNFYENEEVELKYVCDLVPKNLVKMYQRSPTIHACLDIAALDYFSI